jgi:hypothetical protein
MAEEAKAEATKEEPAKPAPLIFKGVCSDGVLKGKEIEGKLDIKVNVESVKAAEAKPKKSEWETAFFWVLFLVMANMIAGDPAGMRKFSSPHGSSSDRISNQSGEQSVLPKNASNAPL